MAGKQKGKPSGIAASVAGATQSTPTRESLLQAYLLDCARVLKLQSWVIRLGTEPCSTDCEAYVTVSQNQHVTVQVSVAFWNYTPKHQRLTIAHELCHVILWRLDDPLDAASELMNADAHIALMAIHTAGIEEVTERFARIVQVLLPLPALGAVSTVL